MSLKLYPETDIQNIADAIRTKSGKSYLGSFTVAQMPTAILNLGREDLVSFLDGTITRYENSYVTTVGGSTFYGCTQLSVASFPNCGAISVSAFYGCSNLKDLYLMGSTMCTLGSINAFTSTPMSGTNPSGTIHVPTSLAASYKAATNWVNYSNVINNDA